jgi:hypothetical protein
VRFNHALHLTPGLPSAAGGKPLWTVGMLAAEDRARYAREGQKDADGVVLDCASCHESPESSDARGAYFPPVSFERHCAACHRLQTPGPEGAMIAVPHGLEPAAVRQSLRERILGALLQSDPELKPQQGRPRPDRRPRKEIEEALRRKVDQGVAVSERLLYEGAKAVCTECHFYRTVAGDTVDQPSPDDLAALDRLRIEPAGIPLVWYPRARFDHQPHRAVECRHCHEQAHPDSPLASRTHLDVQLPTIESCVPCHAPPGGTAVAPRGGVAHTCVTCHRYHAVETPSEIEPAVPRRGLDALLGRSPHPEPENRKINTP